MRRVRVRRPAVSVGGMRVLSRQEMLLFRCGMLPIAEHIVVPLDQTGGTMDPESDAVMRLLAADDYPSVRRAVALNECAPADALRALAFDSVTDVRAGAVSNPAIPEDVLRLIVMRALTSGVETSIRASAAANPPHRLTSCRCSQAMTTRECVMRCR